MLEDFEAHRNSLMQVKEMHKVKVLAGSVEHAGHRDQKNIYINAFFILFYFYSFGNNEENYWHAVVH